VLKKYPGFLRNQRAVELLCNGLRPVIDGKLKPDQLRHLLEVEVDGLEEERHRPVDVLTKTGDALPGFGIVAAVLGVVITMGSISGPIEEIGHHVAAALVGTFLGILLSYGFVNPLAVNMQYCLNGELSYYRCIASSVVGFAGGMAPIMAIELSRRALESSLQPSADELEAMLKPLNAQSKSD
jgi:chemotaxis protein MotA